VVSIRWCRSKSSLDATGCGESVSLLRLTQGTDPEENWRDRWNCAHGRRLNLTSTQEKNCVAHIWINNDVTPGRGMATKRESLHATRTAHSCQSPLRLDEIRDFDKTIRLTQLSRRSVTVLVCFCLSTKTSTLAFRGSGVPIALVQSGWPLFVCLCGRGLACGRSNKLGRLRRVYTRE